MVINLSNSPEDAASNHTAVPSLPSDQHGHNGASGRRPAHRKVSMAPHLSSVGSRSSRSKGGIALTLRHLTLACLALLILVPAAHAADKPKEEDYYKILTYEPPAGVVLEVGALEWMPEGKLAVSTRRGEIWMVSNALAVDPAKDSKFVRFAHGLHEVLGLSYRDGWLYVTQRCELSRLKDTDGDGVADRFETVSDAWEIDGDYHEYAFGSKFDKDGELWVALCLTGSFTSENKYRGWALRISPDGKVTPTCSGLRSPGGMGMNAEGDMFYTDNQGPWNGACSLKHLKPGTFQGNPEGNKWYEVAKDLGKRPESPRSGSRMMVKPIGFPNSCRRRFTFPIRSWGSRPAGLLATRPAVSSARFRVKCSSATSHRAS